MIFVSLHHGSDYGMLEMWQRQLTTVKSIQATSQRLLMVACYCCYCLAIFLHSSAQLRHDWAHLLQCSTSCLSHSFAQASQTSAHMVQNCFANWLSIDISAAEVQQTAAHSRLIWTQLAIIVTSCSLRSEVAQNSQASAHLMHASIQLCHFEF